MYRCFKLCNCGVRKTPTYKEILDQNLCYTQCNAECLQIVDPVKTSECYGSCSCTCNTVCIENCELSENPLICKLGCGCTPADLQTTPAPVPTPTPEPALNPVPEAMAAPVATPSLPEVTQAFSLNDIKNVGEASCKSECWTKCVKLYTTDKSASHQCLSDCNCNFVLNSIEMSTSAEASMISHPSSNVLGYMLFAVFLITVILGTGYLVIDRDDKKKSKPDTILDSTNLLYKRLD